MGIYLSTHPLFLTKVGWEGWNRFVKERVGLIGKVHKGYEEGFRQHKQKPLFLFLLSVFFLDNLDSFVDI
jgi:hypothetical protein